MGEALVLAGEEILLRRGPSEGIPARAQILSKVVCLPRQTVLDRGANRPLQQVFLIHWLSFLKIDVSPCLRLVSEQSIFLFREHQ